MSVGVLRCPDCGGVLPRGGCSFCALAGQLAALGYPRPEPEHPVTPGRRWRFDAAWPAWRVAVEVEGGAYTRGRHVRGAGYVADLEKYNSATLAGWRVLRFTPQQVRDGEAARVVSMALIQEQTRRQGK